MFSLHDEFAEIKGPQPEILIFTAHHSESFVQRNGINCFIVGSEHYFNGAGVVVKAEDFASAGGHVDLSVTFRGFVHGSDIVVCALNEI